MAVTQAALPVGVPPRAGVGPAPSEPNRSFQHTVGLLAVIALRELRFTGLWFQHELHELLVSRALWAMVLISGPLVGFSFLQSIQLYSGSSLNASRLPQLAANLNPLDGVVIPLFGGVYLMNTFLLPFVAIRMIGNDKQTGALKLILQQPIGPYRVIGVKLAALGVGWVIALLPTISALLIWSLLLGGHLYLPELASVILGHALYAFVIAGFGFLAASLTESSATAAIVALSFTLGAWILEFAGGSGGGIVRAIAAFSLSPALRGLERGLLGSPTALTLFVLGLAFLALTVVWLPPGVSRRQKLFRSAAVVGVGAQALLLAIQLPVYVDVTENHRNSFSAADDAAIRQMNRELRVDVNLAQNDSRLRDLDRQVLSKLQRVAPQVTINFPETSTTGLLGGTSGANYGLVTFTYGGRQVTTRATTAREILPLIHKLAGQDVPPDRTPAYPGYPLVTDASAAGVWFYIIVPLLAVGGWWINQRPPRVEFLERQGLTHPDWLTLHGGTLRRAALIFAGALIVIQVIPYGRDHANIQVSPTDVAYGQICQSLAAGPETVLTLGDLRGQVTAMIGTLDSAVVAPSVAAIRAAYGPLVPRFNGVALDIAQFYPGRCPRLLADRALVETAPQGSALEAQSVVAGVQALRAGLASMGQDLDIRIRQEAPENPLAEDPEETTTPTLTGSPYWNSPRTEELATRACAGCHSNQPNLPWYSNVAPLSWFVQHQVDDGRAALNFSEWDRPQPAVSDAAASVLLGRMPPPTAGAIDKRLALTDAERAELAAGLQASFQNTFPAPPRAAASGSANAPLWLVLGLALAAALFVVGYVGSRRSSRTATRSRSRSEPMRILVANEDPTLLRILERGLRAHGFEVVPVASRRSADTVMADQSFGLVLLDTSLPDFGSAREWLQAQAARSPVAADRPLPVFLLLTARQDEIARAEADGLAEDDYLLKPFALEELIGRIRAKTRPANERGASTLQAGDLRVDLMARCAWRGEKVIDLPVREFALLEYFMRHPRRVVSRADILTDVWGYNFASESNLVDVYVRYLRNRIDRPGERSLVATVRGAGYRFDPPDAPGELAAPPGGVAHDNRPTWEGGRKVSHDS